MKAEIIKRIKEFIRTQRYIGANEKLAVMRKRYGKTADEFYKEYGSIYYENVHGQKIGLDIKSIWHFVTLEEKIASLTEQLEKERDQKIKLYTAKSLFNGSEWTGYYLYSKTEDKHFITQDAIESGNLNQFVNLAHFAEIDPKTLTQNQSKDESTQQS